MFVRARPQEGQTDGITGSTQQGVTCTHAATRCCVVGADAETRQIVAKPRRGDKWLVTDGLKAGDRVVVSAGCKSTSRAQVKSAGNTG